MYVVSYHSVSLLFVVSLFSTGVSASTLNSGLLVKFSAEFLLFLYSFGNLSFYGWFTVVQLIWLEMKTVLLQHFAPLSCNIL